MSECNHQASITISLIPTNPEYKIFLTALKNKIASSRYQAVRAVNKELVLLYHYIGTEMLKRQKPMAGVLR